MKCLSTQVSLIATFVYSLAVSIQEHIYAFMFLPALFVIFINVMALKNVFKKLVFLNIFIVVVVISLFVQHDFHGAYLVFARSNLILLTVLLLFDKKSEFDIALGFQQLYCPRKLMSIIFFTAKFILLIRREFGLFKRTLHIRGFEAKTNFLSYGVLSGFVGVLIIKAYERSKYLQNSMIIRGFNGEIYSLRASTSLNLYDKLLAFVLFVSITLHVGVIV